MGYDISYHPVDVDMVHTRIVPYILGQGDIDDLVADAVRVAKVRFRANAWGLGVLALQQEEFQAILAAHPVDEPPRTSGVVDLLARLLGRKRPESPPPPPLPMGEIDQAGFDSDVHVWGRPFLVTPDDPDEISASIDRYMAATPEQVDVIAKEMIDRLLPSLSDRVVPSEEGELPDDERIASGIRWKIDLFRDAQQALEEGRATVTDADGNEHDAAGLFATDCALAVLEFQAQLRPGWAARGYGWPTHLFDIADIDAEGLFQKPDALFSPLLEARPELASHFDTTITENFTVGGFVPAPRVPELVALLQDRRVELLAGAKRSGWDERDAAVYVQGCTEAAIDAQRRSMAFIEATEIYSGAMGIMN